MLLSLLPASAWAKETLIWLLRDLPPLTIFEGPKKGQGAVDQLLPMLIEHMPEYDHSILRVNRARGMQMLQEQMLQVWIQQQLQLNKLINYNK